MRKTLICLTLVLALCATVAAAGCASSTSNSDIQKKATEEIAAAKASLADAKAKGVTVPPDEQAMLTKAGGELEKQPLLALIDAAMAKANIDNDIKDAFALANQTYSTARGAAQAAVKNATPGSDLAAANQSLATAETKKSQATTIPQWYDPANGPIYFANLAGQQAVTASNAKAVANGQQQGATQEQKAISASVTQIIGSMNKYLQSKGFNPADFTVGITKVSPDATWVTGIAAPQNPMPGQPLFTTFIFELKNGQYVLVSAT